MNLFACGIAMAALVAPVTGWSADNPSYQGQVLFLPRVDTPEQAGLYQNGTMRRNADGTWSVISIQALGEGDLTTLLGIGTVVVHATESVPSAVYLKVSGAEARCGSWGPEKVHQRRSGSHFDIHISTSLPSLSTCPAMMYSYRITVPLDVYGLPMGTYTFSVNGVRRGMFTLQRNNRFAEDCWLTQGCPFQ